MSRRPILPISSYQIKRVKQMQTRVLKLVERDIAIFPQPILQDCPECKVDPFRGVGAKPQCSICGGSGFVEIEQNPEFCPANIRWLKGEALVRMGLGDTRKGVVKFYTRKSLTPLIENASKIFVDDREVQVMKQDNGNLAIKLVRNFDGTLDRIQVLAMEKLVQDVS